MEVFLLNVVGLDSEELAEEFNDEASKLTLEGWKPDGMPIILAPDPGGCGYWYLFQRWVRTI